MGFLFLMMFKMHFDKLEKKKKKKLLSSLGFMLGLSPKNGFMEYSQRDLTKKGVFR
jgi:hypothetical protein